MNTMVMRLPLGFTRVFAEPIPMLPPGIAMRMFVDSAADREGQEMPSMHEATVTYSDGHGHQWSEIDVIDVEIRRGLMYAEEFGAHHDAKALRGIGSLLEKARLLKGDVDVTVESRDERDERCAAEPTAEHVERQDLLEPPGLRQPEREIDDGSGDETRS